MRNTWFDQNNQIMAFLAAAIGNSVPELEKEKQPEIGLDSTSVSVNMHAEALAINVRARWPEKNHFRERCQDV